MVIRLKSLLVVFLISSILISAGCATNKTAAGPTVILTYQADLSKKDPAKTDAQIMANIKSIITNRLQAYGITKTVIQLQGSNQVLVKLTGVDNTDKVMSLIGEVGLLAFKEKQYDSYRNPVTDANGNQVWTPAAATGSDGTQEALTGKYLKPNAIVMRDSMGKPEVSFEWNSEGAKLFEQVTTRNLNRPLGIFLDNELISAPTVQAVIKDKGVITGVTIDEAKILVVQLNSGALDIPLQLISYTTNAH
jgi:preprotein translocase subunit SecD